jgi:hypothetical protein
MENTYRNSGSFGDLIYSLCIIPKLGPGKFQVAMNNLSNVSAFYHKFKMVDLMPIHRDYFNETHYELLRPLLERQSYITSVSKWYPSDKNPDSLIDTDAFRGLFGKRYDNNFISMFYAVGGIPFTEDDYSATWLEADTDHVAPFVISRTERYRHPDGHANAYYSQLNEKFNFTQNAVFIGSDSEHAAFERETGVSVRRHKVNNFLEFANAVNGAEMFIGNQTFGFSLAMGLGKPAALEIKPTQIPRMNECWFGPRKDVTYF